MDNDKPMLVLGIETTCDETAAAVVERQGDGSGRILSNIVRSQTDEHARFGGVVPEIAARAHVDLLDGIVARAMQEANVGFAQLSAVAAAAGPGLAALPPPAVHREPRRNGRVAGPPRPSAVSAHAKAS